MALSLVWMLRDCPTGLSDASSSLSCLHSFFLPKCPLRKGCQACVSDSSSFPGCPVRVVLPSISPLQPTTRLQCLTLSVLAFPPASHVPPVFFSVGTVWGFLEKAKVLIQP